MQQANGRIIIIGEEHRHPESLAIAAYIASMLKNNDVNLFFEGADKLVKPVLKKYECYNLTIGDLMYNHHRGSINNEESYAELMYQNPVPGILNNLVDKQKFRIIGMDNFKDFDTLRTYDNNVKNEINELFKTDINKRENQTENENCAFVNEIGVIYKTKPESDTQKLSKWREQEMIKAITNNNAQTNIAICGADHTEALTSELRKLGYNVSVLNPEFLPEKQGRYAKKDVILYPKDKMENSHFKNGLSQDLAKNINSMLVENGYCEKYECNELSKKTIQEFQKSNQQRIQK